MQATDLSMLFQQARQAYGGRRYAKALQLSQRLLSVGGQREEFLNLQGMSQLALGRALEAAASFDRALKGKRVSVGVLMNAVRVDLVLARRRSARRKLDQAIRLGGKTPQVLYQATINFRQLDDYEQAQRLIDRCQQLAPQLAEAWYLKGSMLLDQGDRPGAAAQFREALQRQPDNARALADLSRCEEDDAALEILKSQLLQLSEQARSPWDRSSARFALGDLADKRGELAEAATHYQAANNDGKVVRPFPMDRWQRKQQETLERHAELAAEGQPGEGAGAGLVFIVGMPRSGTSLCEQVLGAHPDSFPCGELNSMDAIELHLAAVLSPEKQRRAYLDALPPGATAAGFTTDKLPMNFERIGMIHQLFPGARFIHCKRHPLDIALSCYRQDFQAGVQWAFDLEQIAEVIDWEEQLMAHWTSCLPEHVLPVHYETLVSDLPGQADALCKFIDVAPDKGMLSPQRNARTVATASRLQVREAVHQRSVEKWRGYEPLLEPVIQRLELGASVSGHRS